MGRWDWLVPLETDALAMAVEAGVPEDDARNVLQDPCGWGFEDIPEADRNAEELASMIAGCVYSQHLSDAEDAGNGPVVEHALDLWLGEVVRRLDGRPRC